MTRLGLLTSVEPDDTFRWNLTCFRVYIAKRMQRFRGGRFWEYWPLVIVLPWRTLNAGPGFLVPSVGIPEDPGLEEGRGDGRVTRGQVFPAVGSDAIRWLRSGGWWLGDQSRGAWKCHVSWGVGRTC